MDEEMHMLWARVDTASGSRQQLAVSKVIPKLPISCAQRSCARDASQSNHVWIVRSAVAAGGNLGLNHRQTIRRNELRTTSRVELSDKTPNTCVDQLARKLAPVD
jgi:hypothetical protein